MTRIKLTKTEILSTIAVVLLLVSENDCEPLELLPHPGNLSGLIFREENRINLFQPDDENLIELVSSSRPTTPVFSCERKTLYWVDEGFKIQAREYFESQSISLIYESKPEMTLTGLALDFVSDKLYIGNDVFRTIEVFDLKTGNRGIIRSEKMPAIHTIAIDPNERYLFVLGENELVRMDLDGLNIHYIFPTTPLYLSKCANYPMAPECITAHISYFTLNLKEKRVYWINQKNGTISSTKYDGTDQKLHLQLDFILENRVDGSHFAFLSNTPYWIDYNKGAIRRLNLSDADDKEMVYKAVVEQTSSLISVDCNSIDHYQSTNPCDADNGGCQHLCILSRSSKTDFRCFCNAGYELANDGKSCTLPTELITFTQLGYVRSINFREDRKQYIDVFDPSKRIAGRGNHFNVDTEEGGFYPLNCNHNHQSFSEDKSWEKINLRPDLQANEACDIAFDWASKNLYYINRVYRDGALLRVLNTKNPTYSKILTKIIGFESGLVIHPNRGYVFYVEENSIKRIHTDGSNSTLLYNHSHIIHSIAVDYIEDKIYWTGYGMTIKHSNLDGTNIAEVQGYSSFFASTAMAIQRDWIYVLNWSQGLKRILKKGGELEQLIISDYTKNLRIFDASIQTTRNDHPCANSEKICSKFCFAVPNAEKVDKLERVCGCPYGEKLADDGISCVDNSKEVPPLVPCSSFEDDCFGVITDNRIKFQ